MMIEERWRPVVGHPGYEVSDLGKVARIRADGARRIMKQSPAKGGYRRLNLGRGNQKKVQRLVLEAFVGPCPPDHEAGHLDGDPANNALTNLAWVTHRENMVQMSLHGRSPRGERSHWARVTAAKVVEIRRRRLAGESVRDLCSAYKLSDSQIERIVTGKSWAHVTATA